VGFFVFPVIHGRISMSTPTVETKSQRIERLKREKNAWERLDEVREFARKGYEAIPTEWLGTYFRAWGVYTQGDGVGALGGKGGEGKAVPYFMVRIRVPNGLLTSQQVRAIAEVSERSARGLADLTVRQNVQLHWVAIEALPDVLETLWRVGLTTKGSCGDDARNITGCPLAGIDGDELCDASPLVSEATCLLVGNPAFYNLPRKFKVCITGCPVWCSYPEINDVGLTAITRSLEGRPEVGFSLRVGGGLSTEPAFAQRLDAFVRRDQVIPVIQGVTEIFRDAAELRENRERARLKYLFLRHGWTKASFLAELERRIGFRLDPGVEENHPADIYRDHVGIHPQKQPGYSYVGAEVLRGRIRADQLRAAAELAERFASGELRTTNMQNLLIANVPNRRAAVLARELEAVGLHPGGSSFARGAVACTGTEFCKLAITETKSFTRWLVEELEERLPEFDQPLRLNVTGCPNSCGQHWIADIGIEGKKIKVGHQLTDAYYFCLGGSVGSHQAFARPIGYRCTAIEVPDAIARLLRAYLEGRLAGENLRQFFARYSNEKLRSFLAGSEVIAVARDPSPGRVPHGVEG
jgi:sulfite reductase (ferredoxin)